MESRAFTVLSPKNPLIAIKVVPGHFTTRNLIICLGLIAFSFGTIGGVLLTKLLYKITGGKVNPLIGNVGVSAMPMAARVSQKIGQEKNPQNHLLMHAMEPIVSSTIGSALIAAIFITLFVKFYQTNIYFYAIIRLIMLTFLMFGQFFSDFVDVVLAVLPFGISIMGIMLGIKAVPRIIRMFF